MNNPETLKPVVTQEVQTELLAVTQEDRDAAADFLEAVGAATPEAIQGTREGRYHIGLSQAFARHREAALRDVPSGLAVERVGWAIKDAISPDQPMTKEARDKAALAAIAALRTKGRDDD